MFIVTEYAALKLACYNSKINLLRINIHFRTTFLQSGEVLSDLPQRLIVLSLNWMQF